MGFAYAPTVPLQRPMPTQLPPDHAYLARSVASTGSPVQDPKLTIENIHPRPDDVSKSGAEAPRLSCAAWSYRNT